MKAKEQQRKPMARVNTRIREDQKKFVQAKAKKESLTEGEVFREIIDFYMKKAPARKKVNLIDKI